MRPALIQGRAQHIGQHIRQCVEALARREDGCATLRCTHEVARAQLLTEGTMQRDVPHHGLLKVHQAGRAFRRFDQAR